MSRRAAIERMNYWSDPRTISGMISDDSFFAKGSKTKIDMNWVAEKYDDHQCDMDWNEWLDSMNIDENQEVRCTSRWQPCSQCGGKGSMVNPSIDCGGISAQDFAEDPDFADAYFSGHYDVQCSACRGTGEEHILEHDTSNPLYNWCCDRLEEHYEMEAEIAAERAAEMRWGC